MTARAQKYAESRFVASTSCHRGASISMKCVSRAIPALFTRMSTGPTSRVTPSKNAVTEGSLVTSHCPAQARPPFD